MDENSISVLCAISGCEWRVVGDTRCVGHNGHPSYAVLPSPWGDDADEYNATADNEPPSTAVEGATTHA